MKGMSEIAKLRAQILELVNTKKSTATGLSKSYLMPAHFRSHFLGKPGRVGFLHMTVDAPTLSKVLQGVRQEVDKKRADIIAALEKRQSDREVVA